MMEKIKTFTDLIAWQRGHVLVVRIYQVTAAFPTKETYSLVDQMRRAASSVTANIAEGFGRQTYKEKIQFYYLASGSLTELEDQLLIARDVGYINKTIYESIFSLTEDTHKLLAGLIRSTKERLKLASKI